MNHSKNHSPFNPPNPPNPEKIHPEPRPWDSELRCTSCRLRIYLHMVFFFRSLPARKKNGPFDEELIHQRFTSTKTTSYVSGRCFWLDFVSYGTSLASTFISPLISGVHVYVHLSTPLTDCHQHQGRATFKHILSC